MNRRHLFAVLVVALIGLPVFVLASVAAATEIHSSETVAPVPAKEIHFKGTTASVKANCQQKGSIYDGNATSGICVYSDGTSVACTDSGTTDKNGNNCTRVQAGTVPKKYRGQIQQLSLQLTHFLLLSPTGTPGILSTPPAGRTGNTGGTANTGGATTTTGTTTPRTTAGTKPPGTTTATNRKPTTSTSATP